MRQRESAAWSGRAALVTCAVIVGAAIAITAPPAANAEPRGGPLPVYPPETPYSVALHVHGSLSEQFGSWEWHDWKAAEAGVDVVWWTDHDWRLSNWRHTTHHDFEGTYWRTADLRWVEPDDAFPGEERWWVPADALSTFLQSSRSDTLAYEGTRSLRLEATGTPGSPAFETEYIEQLSSQLQSRYSLAKRVRLRFAVFPEDLDVGSTRFVLEAELSDHPEGTHILRYVLGDMEGEGVHSTSLAFTAGIWNTYEVDITADAIAHFSAGGIDTLRAEDNSLASVKIRLETQSGANAVAFFDDYQILVDPAQVDQVLLDQCRDTGAYYETLYPTVANHYGTEISKFKAQPHINAFAPNLQLIDYTGHIWADSLFYAIDQVHDQGGALSLNHTLGTAEIERTPGEQAGWLQYRKVQLIGNRALGVDMLEVGYRRRGGMDLGHHLDLWDALVANGIWIMGNGVTDSHGRGFFDLDGWGASELGNEYRNNFVTWLHSEAFDDVGFIRAMKSGRAFFGDPYRWDGSLDLRTTDGFRMGQVVLTDRDQHDLSIEITNVPPDVKVRLKQGEVRESQGNTYLVPNWLRDEMLTGGVVGGVFTDTVTLGTTLPSFVRIEVFDGLDQELVYSNPIHFVRAAPVVPIPAERVAVRLGEVRVFRAEGFSLADASLDASPVLTLTGDEAVPGMGEIRIDPGLLGPPLGVTGANSWSFTGGTLTLQGFAGSGSTVEVSWVATDVGTSLPRPAELSLGPARPNPFGGGTVFDYVVPREAWVRLDVLDTSGRRVRVLAAGFRAAGAHRVEWDGLDEGGRPVASGVYHLRLEHDGEVLVRKAVRLR